VDSYRSGVVAPSEAAVARWRRLDDAMDRVRAAPLSSDSAMPDAVAAVLDAMYDLWELWSREAGLPKIAQQDAAVCGDPDGQTAAGLIFARGGKTHAYVEFGERLGFGTQPFGTSPFGIGGWYWQSYADARPHLANRSGWYAERVRGRDVLDPLGAAYRWLRSRPQLKLSTNQ
jgi:hypothetical protein